MSGQTTATVGAVGAIAAAGASGELAQVFNELWLVLAIMGAFGGLTHGLALRLPWREVARGLVLGALLASGFGVFGPAAVANAFGLEAAAAENGVKALAAAAYLIGFGQNIVFDWVRGRAK